MRLNLLRHSRERGNPAFLYCCGRKLGPRFRGGDARWAVFIFLFFAVSAHAQNLVTSPRPDHVAVTVYRDPNRAAAQAPNLSFLNGYALISETRAVSLPAGESELRFEGVAGGILPQSAIVSGLGDGVIERNRDAWLLSPGTLIERSLGRRVHLRRTSRATGAVREEEAVVRSGADGALVLQTPAGFEALRCSGLAETVTYDGVPAGLAARPTLSVRVRAPQPMTATVTLSYLSSGFSDDHLPLSVRVADRLEWAWFAWAPLLLGALLLLTGSRSVAAARSSR